MKDKFMAILRTSWAYILSWKTALKTKIDAFKITLTVTGWQIVVVGLVSFVVVFGAYWTGRLHDLTHGARSYAVALLQPEPEAKMLPLAMPEAPKPTDPNVALVSANAALEQKLEQATKIANAWKTRADEAQSEVAKLKAAKPTTKVRYVRVRDKSFVCDVFGACN